VAGRIVREDVDALREGADALAVLGDYTTLKRAGKAWKGLCPFHPEKTPSFNVDITTNRWYCFGCSEGGDLFDFLMRVEGLDFPDAVEALARRSGVTLRYEEMSAREKRALGEKSRMVEVNRAALDWFRAQLFSERGTVARDYLKARGFGREDADRFQVGFAPDEWEGLTRHLTVDEGFDRQDVLGVRLARPNDRGGLRDTFRGRLVFPVLDVRGDPIGFGGRVLPAIDYGDFEPPKYLNSPEYALYHKHKVLYGLHEARADVVAADEVLVCEGYTDVMALHQAGFGNAVATCGTAVGPDHLRLLARYAKRIVLAFDGDAAGEKAARRAFDAAREVEKESGDRGGFSLRVLVLPEGLDPADLVRERGLDTVRASVAEAPDVVPFLVRRLVAATDLHDEEARLAALHEAVEVLGLESDPDRRRMWARSEVSSGLGVSLEFVQRTAARQGVQLDAHAGVARNVATRQRGRITPADLDRARARRERDLLRIVVQQAALLPEAFDELGPDDLAHPRARAVLAAVLSAGGAGAAFADVLDAAVDDEDRRLLQELRFEEPDVDDSTAFADELVRQVLAQRLDELHGAVSADLASLHHATEGERVRELLAELQDLEQRRRALRDGAPVGADRG
jgi:DNA primase